MTSRNEPLSYGGHGQKKVRRSVRFNLFTSFLRSRHELLFLRVMFLRVHRQIQSPGRNHLGRRQLLVLSQSRHVNLIQRIRMTVGTRRSGTFYPIIRLLRLEVTHRLAFAASSVIGQNCKNAFPKQAQ